MNRAGRAVRFAMIALAALVAGLLLYRVARHSRSDIAQAASSTHSPGEPDAGPQRAGELHRPPRAHVEDHASPPDSAESSLVTAERSWQYVQQTQRCRALRSHEQWRMNHEDDAPPSPMDEATAAVLRRECAGFEFDWRRAQRELERAAALGSTAAQRVYAENPGLALHHASAEAEAWRRWRDRAPGYLDAAIDRGDGEVAMLYGLASMRNECNSEGGMPSLCMRTFPLNAILARDDVDAYAHLLLAQQLGVGDFTAELNARLVALGASLSDTQRAEAAARAAALRGGR
ncbi:MAG: hypothetical protein J0L88_06770 [Xanthomonadales bacterium]|nr:hypothetical protein [Xanthomonadales bacterium]